MQKLESEDNEDEDAMAVSTDIIDSAQSRMRGIGFTLLGAGADFTIGFYAEDRTSPGNRMLKRKATVDELCRSMDFSVTFWAPGNLFGVDGRSASGVCEVGSCMKPLDEPAAGDRVEIAVNSKGRVEYRVNSEIRYESQRLPTYPMKVGISAQSCGLLASELRWLHTAEVSDWLVVIPSIESQVPGAPQEEEGAKRLQEEPRGNLSPSTTSSRDIPADDMEASASSAVSFPMEAEEAKCIEAAVARGMPPTLPPAAGASATGPVVPAVTSQEQDLLLHCVNCFVEALCRGLGAIVGCICQLFGDQRKLLPPDQTPTYYAGAPYEATSSAEPSPIAA